ncbi:MAG: magnesium/cobalt transporter CorA [Saprospiraceae bacterium]|nr:magnesium/cobalt transporter CorA [Saprospiraceae bacterium]
MKSKNPHKRKLKRPGAPPGTLEFTGERKLENPVLLRIRFNPQELEAKKDPTGDDVFATSPDVVTWFDLMGLHDVKLIEQFGQQFNIHPLVLEDILHTQQRPKFEEYGNDAFVVVQSLTYDNATHDLNAEQIAIYFGENFLITFQENEDDTFKAVRERLEMSSGRIRSRKSDYLTYALIDNVVDNYFEVLDRFEERMEELEAEITDKPSRTTKENIHHLKFQMLAMRKSVMPLRDAVNKFSRCESNAVDETTGIYLRDLYDHVLRIADLIETYRDMLNGLVELYHSELSLRMNNVMQVLTVITTIFVPLTFLVGVYGMNFDNMPETHWEYGYFYLWGLMIVIGIALFFYFKRKKWM